MVGNNFHPTQQLRAKKVVVNPSLSMLVTFLATRTLVIDSKNIIIAPFPQSFKFEFDFWTYLSTSTFVTVIYFCTTLSPFALISDPPTINRWGYGCIAPCVDAATKHDYDEMPSQSTQISESDFDRLCYQTYASKRKCKRAVKNRKYWIHLY